MIDWLLDKHAPLKLVRSTRRQAAPWYDDECRAAKAKRRKAEKFYRHHRSTDCLEEWHRQSQNVRSLFQCKYSILVRYIHRLQWWHSWNVVQRRSFTVSTAISHNQHSPLTISLTTSRKKLRLFGSQLQKLQDLSLIRGWLNHSKNLIQLLMMK